jgi:hypothetical protein
MYLNRKENNMVVIFNDGDLAIQYFDDGVGSIQRVKQATREQFLEDFPVDVGFMEDMFTDMVCWVEVQLDIANTLADIKGKKKWLLESNRIKDSVREALKDLKPTFKS